MTLGRRGIDTMMRLRRLQSWFKRRVLHRAWMADSFAHPAVQGRLLSDKSRCNSFREAIRRTVRPGDTVVDLGAGTGLLSFFALEAGARHVYAIEVSRIAETARELIEANGFQKRITFILDLSTKVSLPEPCDVLVSETLSAFCFDTENNIRYIADARRRFLKPGARIIPESAETFLVPFSSEAFGLGSLPEPFYGLNYQAFRKQLFAGPFLLRASGEAFVELSNPEPCYKIDFLKDSEFPRKTFVPFQIDTDGRLDGFLGWFEAKLCPGVTISNSPNLPLTNWWQLYFPTLEQLNVRTGQSVVLELEPKMVADEAEWFYAVRCLDA
jgi:SAM-dependent methyltransferase